MSIEAMAWALNVKGLDPTAKLVLLGLANHAHKDGSNAWPSLDTLASYANVSERTVRRHLRDLTASGMIFPESGLAGGRRPTTYRLILDALEELERMDTDVPPGGTPTTGGQIVPPLTQGGHPLPPTPDTSVPPGGTPITPEPYLEPSTQPSTTEHLAPTSRRDELFETVAEVCGIDWHELTASSRGALNRAVADLRSVDADRLEVLRRAANWNYDVPLTPPALAKHWPALGSSRPRSSTQTSRLAAMADELEAQGL